MAINFPDTTDAPTDGSFTHIHLHNTWVWNGISWSIQNIISTYTDSDVDTHLNKTSSITDGYVLSWDTSLNSNLGDYAWVEQTSGGTNYTDSNVDTHLNKTSSDGYVLSWDAAANNNQGDYAWVPNVNQTLGITPSPPTDGHVLSWSDAANNNTGGYAWVPQSSGGTNYTDSNVDTHLNRTSSITSGYVLSWDQSLNAGQGDYAWIPNTNQTLGVMTSIPTDGHVLSWSDAANNNQGGYAWVPQSSGGTSGGGSSVSIAETAPSSPSSGDLWWDSNNGNLKIYYTDANSSQWVDTYATQASSGGGGSSSSSLITDGTSTLSFDSNNNISVNTHFIPDTNASYDLGSAEYKIRHLFLSDNSLWIGDGHKIDTSDGTFKTRKRKKNTVPSSIIEAYKTSTGNSSATLQEVSGAAIAWLNSESYSVTELKEITLDMWIKYLNFLDSTKDNVEDLYPPEYINDSENINYKLEDYDEVIGQKQEGKVPASITTEEGGFYNLILFKSKRMVIIDPTTPININVIGAEPIDGNTVEFTVYIKQLDPAQEITGLQIDGLQVSQLRDSGFWNNIYTPIPSPNKVNICLVKAVCIANQWFATVYWT